MKKAERKDGPGRKPRTEAARGVFFNLSVATLERLERLAKDFGTSRTKIVELALEKLDKPRPETESEKIAEIRRILE